MVLRLILFILFIGCNSNTLGRLPPKSKVMSMSATYNPSLYYQGKGSGNSRAEALVQALNDAASHVAVSIKSESISNTEIINSIGKHKFIEKLKSKVKETSFYGYKTVQDNYKNGFYKITLLVNKKELASRYVKNLEQVLLPLEERLKQSSSDFKKYLVVKKYNINDLYAQLNLINIIDKSYPISKYELKFKNYFKILSKPIVFNLKGNSSDVLSLSKSFLNDKGFSVSSSGSITFNIELSPIQKSKIYHEYVGTANITLTISDTSKSIFSKVFRLSGVSTLSEYYVKEDILNNLKKKLNEELKEIL